MIMMMRAIIRVNEKKIKQKKIYIYIHTYFFCYLIRKILFKYLTIYICNYKYINIYI